MTGRLSLSGRSALVFGILAVALAGWGAYAVFRENAAADAFAKALRAADIQEQVTVDGTAYAITDGAAVAPGGSTVSGLRRLPILRTAYALVLARRFPLLDISGSDPAALASSTAALEEATDALAQAQPTARASQAIKTALYPFAFLRALASLEEARAAFAASGSDRNAEAYEHALGLAAAAGTRDIAAFSKAFAEEAGTENQTIMTLSGAVSLAQMKSAISDIQTRFEELNATLKKQNRCLDGAISDCRTDLSVPLPAITAAPSQAVARPNANPLYVLSGDPAQNTYLALEQSACLREAPGPYLFLYNPSIPSRMPLHYVGDAYFSSMPANNGPVIRYLLKTYGMTYLLLEPLQFYECPEVETDIGRSYALLATAAFAKKYPRYAQTERAALLGERAYSEELALAYVRAATEELNAAHLPENDPALAEFETLSRQWRAQDAGLDMLVADIASVLARDQYLTSSGAPFDITAQTMFLTHSAFPSLFLAENPTAGTASVTPPIVSAGDQARISKQFTLYSSLIKTVPLATVRHDIEAFARFEGLGN